MFVIRRNLKVVYIILCIHVISLLLLLLVLLSGFNHVRLCATPRWQLTRLPHPWDSPGKNTGVGCHFLLQSTSITWQMNTLLSPSPLLPCTLSLPSFLSLFIQYSFQVFCAEIPLYSTKKNGILLKEFVLYLCN